MHVLVPIQFILLSFLPLSSPRTSFVLSTPYYSLSFSLSASLSLDLFVASALYQNCSFELQVE